MVKLKALFVIALFSGMFLGAKVSVAVLPTFDAPVLGTDVGMVGQGVTSIQQYGESIANGSLTNSILGDSAGTLAKLRKKYGADIEKAKKALQDAQKRIEDGQKAYAEYSKEIEKRKKEYQELMDSVEQFVGSKIKTTYDDSEMEADAEEYDEDYVAEYDAGLDADFDQETLSTSRIADAYVKNAELEDPYDSYTGEVREMIDAPETQFDVPVFNKLPTEEEAQIVPISAEVPLQTKGSPLQKEAPLQKRELSPSEPDKAIKLRTSDVEKAGLVEKLPIAALPEPAKVSSIVNETTGRKKFITMPQKETVAKVEKNVNAAAAAVSSINAVAPTPAPAPAALKAASPALTAQPKAINGVGAIKAAPALPSSEVNAKAAPRVNNTQTLEPKSPAAERQFRVSPTVKMDKISSSTIHFSRKMMFAASVGGATQGSKYDVNGTYVSPFAKRCGLSIDDLVNDDAKMTECLQKIVRDNHSENSFEAENNRKDCQKMVYDMVFAVAAETSQIRNNASGYDKTIESLREQGEESTDVRGDMSVIALSNEKILQKLNEMSQMMSAYTLLQAVEQVCAAPKEIVEDTESSDGGE